MELLEPLLYLKEKMKSKIRNEDSLIKDIEVTYNIPTNVIANYFNLFVLIKSEKNQRGGWSKPEDQFVEFYLLDHPDRKRKQLLEQLSLLIDRTLKAITLRIYNLQIAEKEMEKTIVPAPQPETDDIVEIIKLSERIDQAAAEEVKEKLSLTTESLELVPYTKPIPDILDSLTSIITNIQSVEGFDLHSFFEQLGQLVQRAAKHQLEPKLLEEKDEKITLLEKQNLTLQNEITEIKKLVLTFDKLENSQKIIKLKEYNENLRYAVDQTGIVLPPKALFA